ncbi:hypothetical protein [Pelagicoccus mobilis]|uniref:Uncharacterized protein n=1 Tax=Pelagicoccus mobilis TaxID=415221 RepID=A0A934RVJ0_9BACT|nr:hypothetical protein [Pelagicoccus mobilis]MBK1875596.1 hypothetical protein [Pelagicoccus mobilis]
MNTHQIIENDGLYLRGTVIGSKARAFKSKDDGRVSVMISHDIAYDGELLSWTQYVDPSEVEGLKLEGLEVLEFPSHEKFKPITLKILRSKVYQNRLSVTSAEVMESEAA